MQAGLYIIATPIGNLDDISFRAIDTLKKCDVVACEDKRVSAKLFNKFDIKTKKISYHEHSPEKTIDEIILRIEEGEKIGLISDAGTPIISDPGYKLVKKLREKNLFVTSITGPCAVVNALVLSGLASDRFLFAGFLPQKQKAKQDIFKELKDSKATIVFYESPNRLLKTISSLIEVMGNRKISVCREMTKFYEEVITKPAKEVLKNLSQREKIKGEIVLIIEKSSQEKLDFSNDDLEKLLIKELEKNSLKTAVMNVCEKTKMKKKIVYNKALEIKNGKE